jgi:hypothetical protein
VLALICRVGQSIQIGPDIRLTVQARQGARVAIGIEAPPGLVVRLDTAALQPLSPGSRVCTYLFSLQSIRSFRVGPVEIRVWLPGEMVPLAAACTDSVHVGVIASGPMRLTYAPCSDPPMPVVGLLAPATLGALA